MFTNPESRPGVAALALSIPLALGHLATPPAHHEAPPAMVSAPTPIPMLSPDLVAMREAKIAVQKTPQLSPMAKLRRRQPELVEDFIRVAHYESGGRWHINTGNGYSSGLQFSPTTWDSFDTEHFAPEAYQATKAEQIIVAIRVLNRQGWGAWPVTCHEADVC